MQRPISQNFPLMKKTNLNPNSLMSIKMSLFLLLVLLVLLQSSMAVLQIDCVGNNYTSIPDCREYLYAYMQSYTGNVGLNSGLPDVDQGYYKEEIVFTKDDNYVYNENE